MKIVLISMPDVIPIIIPEMALHMPNHGIDCIGGNFDEGHEVYLVDMVRKCGGISTYLTRSLKKITPDLIGLSAMTWQYPTSLAVMGLIKSILPHVKIAIGGYRATLMGREMTASSESQEVDFIVRIRGSGVPQVGKCLGGRDKLGNIPSARY
jgi:anaerobic magnesium-protoporphyrin IX monomethyl ester cyclase